MSVPRPRTIALIACGLVVLGGAGAAAVGFGGEGSAAPEHGALPPATAKVERTTLAETEDVDGTLGYGDARTVSARSQGTITWLAPEGATVARGKPVYRVDTDPVPLLYGTMPFYRTLRSGVEGSDVKLLERNLRALGYTGFTVDKEYTSATADAVREWQEDLGLDETGSVEPGAVVVAPGRIRVAEQRKEEGDAASGPVLTHTGTTRLVTVDLPVEDQQLVKRGAAVEVELPGGDTARGRITRVGKVATLPSGEDAEDEEATVEVLITLRGGASGGFDQAPVTVRLESERREDVLAVPVGALLALPGGKYGVQVVQGGAARTVPVETGMFADGKVEVSGPGLAEGMQVGIGT